MTSIGFFLVAMVTAVGVGLLRGFAQPSTRFRPAPRPARPRKIRIEAPPQTQPALREPVLVESRA